MVKNITGKKARTNGAASVIKILLKSLLCFTLVFSLTAYAKDVKTHDQISNAIKNSQYGGGFLKSHASEIASLAINVESGGDLHAQNSCCTGVLQVNGGGLKAFYSKSPNRKELYKYAGLQTQVDVWLKLTQSQINSAVVKSLMSRGTFDGRTVDVFMVVSCIQLGVGNCQKMLRSGSCSGFRDSNGTSICDMARKMAGGKKGSPITSGETEDDDGFLSEVDGTGVASAFDITEPRSFDARIKDAARYRFYSDSWTKSITSISSRALYADYVAANGLEVYLQEEIYRKKEHIEALLAVYTAQQIKAGKGTREANRLARQNGIESAIK